MILKARLEIKFRAFGRDWGKPLVKTFAIPIPTITSRLISFNDGAAVERYTRRYDYDVSGNITQMRHTGATRNWTKDFWISPSSNRSLPALDPGSP